ncbi:hypothetical protein R1flu_015259 [Riccia fluitans]|uniref:Ubiquitin-like protease family profile domain-containing protein n=1 Tax=Riccia fluitans TaxID=41844 RepID=A0ABD1YIE6_9MARC
MLSNILEHLGRVNQRLASLEEDLVHSKREEEKLKATIEALEKEKSEMNARVTLMERKDLYELLEAKMEGFQIANHSRTIGGFENLNLIIMRKWMEIPTLNLEEFEKFPANYPESIFPFVDLTQYMSSPKNKGSEDQGWPFLRAHDQEAIFHVLKQVLCLTMPIDPTLVQTGIMNVEQQQDGHSCGKHVLQMLAGAGKESEGLDRCFREEGLDI